MSVIRDQLAAAIMETLDADGLSQADLARKTGLSAKHINHLVHGSAGSFGVYEYVAFVLGRHWTVALESGEAGK
mgnify:CR=1 FL=1